MFCSPDAGKKLEGPRRTEMFGCILVFRTASRHPNTQVVCSEW